MIKKLTQLLKTITSRIDNRYIIISIASVTVFTVVGAIWLVFLIQPKTAHPQTAEKSDCASCHPEIHAGWHNGGHSDKQSKSAMAQGSNCGACHKETPVSMNTNNTESSVSFADFWVKEGMPNNCLSCHVTGYDATNNTWVSDGITCEACHGVIPENHPDAVASTVMAADNCVTCHTDDRFDWGKWKDSVHFQNSITCVDCHNPHTTSLQTVAESNGTATVLCEGCHENIAETAEHSTHTKVGISCTDCHLGDPKGNDDFHQVPDHDFKPKIETCNKCHENQMHSIGEAQTSTEPLNIEVVTKAASVQSTIHTQQLPKPAGFIMVAMLFGVIGGTSLRKSFFRKKQ